MSDEEIEVTALAVNVTIPDHLRWTDIRRGDEFTLMTLNVLRGPARPVSRPPVEGRAAVGMVLDLPGGVVGAVVVVGLAPGGGGAAALCGAPLVADGHRLALCG